MKASGSLLRLYLFMHSNGSQKLFKEHGPIGKKHIKCFGLRFVRCSCFTYTLASQNTTLSRNTLEKEVTSAKLSRALDYVALQVLHYRSKVRHGLTALQIHSYEETTSEIKKTITEFLT